MSKGRKPSKPLWIIPTYDKVYYKMTGIPYLGKDTEMQSILASDRIRLKEMYENIEKTPERTRSIEAEALQASLAIALALGDIADELRQIRNKLR